MMTPQIPSNRDLGADIIIQVRLPFHTNLLKWRVFSWLVAGGEVRGLPCLCWHEDVKAHGKNRWPVVIREVTHLTASKEIQTSQFLIS